jgi:hypothetical protein
MLVAKRLIDLPKEFVVVLLYSIQQLFFFILLHLCKNFVSGTHAQDVRLLQRIDEAELNILDAN